MFEAEVFKLYGLRHTNMTMHERFTLLAHKPLRWGGKLTSYFIGTQSKSMNPELLLALTHPLEGQAQRPVRVFAARGRGRGRGGLHRTGSEGSFRGLRGLPKSNSYRNISQSNKDQKWRRSNGNLSANGSVYSGGGSEKSWGSGRSGHRGRGARGRGRGRGFRNRTNRGRVTRVTETAGVRGRPARGVGRRGLRRNIPGAQDAPARGRGTGYQRGRGRGRGGISRNQQPKLMLTKEELDAQLDQYMAGTKASLDKELEEYMSRAMDYD